MNDFSAQSTGSSSQFATPMQMAQSVNSVSGDVPYSPSSNTRTFSSVVQSVSNGAVNMDTGPIVMQNSTPNRPSGMSQHQGTLQMSGQQPHTPIRPSFTKQNAPHSSTQTVQNSQMQNHQQLSNSGAGNVPNGNFNRTNEHPQAASASIQQQYHPPHVPDQLPAPTPQAMPNPYRQGSFEANGWLDITLRKDRVLN